MCVSLHTMLMYMKMFPLSFLTHQFVVFPVHTHVHPLVYLLDLSWQYMFPHCPRPSDRSVPLHIQRGRAIGRVTVCMGTVCSLSNSQKCNHILLYTIPTIPLVVIHAVVGTSVQSLQALFCCVACVYIGMHQRSADIVAHCFVIAVLITERHIQRFEGNDTLCEVGRLRHCAAKDRDHRI